MKKKLTVLGGGVLGSQIAYQAAYCGHDVTIWLRSEGSIGRAQPKIDRLHGIYTGGLKQFKGKTGNPEVMVKFPRGFYLEPEKLTEDKLDELIENAEKAYKNLKLELSYEEAFKDPDVVIEAIAENTEEKIDIYEKMQKYLPEKTIICTNSSTFMPSTFAEYTGRPEKYLALHFANNIWQMNIAEVMGHPGTEEKYYEQAVEFAKTINMYTMCLRKEQPGYILNSMLVPLLASAQTLLVNGVADPKTIDDTWTIATGAPMGPFRILDIVGLQTAYNIVKNFPDAKDPNTNNGKVVAMLKKYIDEGKLGINAGEGFYKYK